MAEEKENVAVGTELSFDEFKKEVLNDYRIANISRETSLLGRKEVLTGKAKFGIFGDGKEVAQLAMAKHFKKGDWRSGYYRDQTFMMAIDCLTVQQFFAQLYAHTDLEADPASGGRQMNGHYATRSLDENGEWKNLVGQYNSSADISPTGSQMPRLLGLAHASKLFRNNKELQKFNAFSNNGNEVAFGTIGDASTSEGLFWETLNAAGVMQVPMAISVWDDGYGISVPKKYQTTKESISEILAGFEKGEYDDTGYHIFKTKGWDYPHLCATYEKAISVCRSTHTPVLIHVEELTQPQGHSTSGSHERYKTKERLAWAEEFDCIRKMREWIVDYEKQFGNSIATVDELETIEQEAKEHVKQAKKEAWAAYTAPIKNELAEVAAMLTELGLEQDAKDVKATINPGRKEVVSAARIAYNKTRGQNTEARKKLGDWINRSRDINKVRYSSSLYSEGTNSALKTKHNPAQYNSDFEEEDGRIILRNNFEKLFEKYPLSLTFGEDTGFLGGVNQSLEGMQEKFGKLRVFDTGIREATIVGQGIGLAMRGLRPIAEIQYLDYLHYCLQVMSDDLSTVRYRTMNGQMAPLIVRTRGHRLEGVWHAGSHMGAIIHMCRGIYVCVPRNMTQAAGFYNTLMQSDDPALVVEVLNGYRTKERVPTNLGEFTVPLGVPEIIKEGTDITLVSYGATLNICTQVANELTQAQIDVEVIDVQTLLPFDINHTIVESVKKTNRLMVIDEDVPGGASAFILDKILTEQGGYYYLDSEPITLSAKDHRPAYASDGDYFSKPNAQDIYEAAYGLMNEADPNNYPA